MIDLNSVFREAASVLDDVADALSIIFITKRGSESNFFFFDDSFASIYSSNILVKP